MRYSSKTVYEAVLAVRQGMSLRKTASLVGVSYETVRRWCSHAGIKFATGSLGGAVLTKRVCGSGQQSRLLLEHRLAIAMGLAAGHTHARIAQGIGFARSTVSREISRHTGSDKSYDPYKAQLAAERDASRPKVRKTDASVRLRSYVKEKLSLRWSPKQISIQIALDYPHDKEMRVSHEAIYQALYVQGKGALRQELKLEKALRSGRKSRLPQSRLAYRGKNKSWVEGCNISERPAEVADRAVPGHWEEDLVLGSDLKSCLITLVERKTRFVLVRRLDMHPTELVTNKLAEMISEVPQALTRTITWDQGIEMSSHASFTDKTGVKVYFCDPHSPWQRGTNENTNGLIRDYFSKGTNFAKVTDAEVQEMQDQLNGRPRQTLGWKKPADAYAELLKNASSGAMTA